MEHEVKTSEELVMEALRIARSDKEAFALWGFDRDPLVAIQLPKDREGRTWTIDVECGARPELTAALQRAAVEVQKRWSMAVPCLGSSARQQ